MPCYHPLHGWRKRGGRNPLTGAWGITFKIDEAWIDLPVTVPCGKCIGCRLEHSRQWAIRCIHEASLYEHNCFLTLTYNDRYIDPNESLNKTDIQLFLKRLRKRYSDHTIRFFQCGEYGDDNARPHHHVLLFNHDFMDKKFHKFTKYTHYPLYISKELSELWPYGYHDIAEVNFLTAAYTARYIMKKVNGEAADDHYLGRLPEFITMSRRPGIGYDWFKKYYHDIYPKDYVVVNNIKCKPPKYYDTMFDSIQNKYKISKIKFKRRIKAMKNPENNNNDWRLLVKEHVRQLKIARLKRPLL